MDNSEPRKCAAILKEGKKGIVVPLPPSLSRVCSCPNTLAPFTQPLLLQQVAVLLLPVNDFAFWVHPVAMVVALSCPTQRGGFHVPRVVCLVRR